MPDTGASASGVSRAESPEQPRQRKSRREERRKRQELLQSEREELLENNEKALIDNPLRHLTREEIELRVASRFRRWDFPAHDLDLALFKRAGLVAKNVEECENVPGLSVEEKRIFRLEQTAGFWDETHIRIPIALACCAAIVQGFTQSSSNGANLYICKSFGMKCGQGESDLYMFAFQNAAPFLAGSLAGCWLSDPLNEWLYGRRGAVFIAAICCFIGVVGSAFATDRYMFLAFRLVLGLGMGQKASVVPIYAAEVSPAQLRVFTALGIAASFTCNLLFAYTIKNPDVAWRLMIGSSVLSIMPLLLVFACPESPRYLMKRGLYIEAYKSLLRLRGSPIAAAKEIIYLDAQLEAAEAKLIKSKKTTKHKKLDVEAGNLSTAADSDIEIDVEKPGASGGARESVLTQSEHDPELEEDDELVDDTQDPDTPQALDDGPRGFVERAKVRLTRMWYGGEPKEGVDPFLESFRSTNYFTRILDLLRVARCRRASFAAGICMIAQQLCGINILAFYSSILYKSDSPVSGLSGNGTVPFTFYNGTIAQVDPTTFREINEWPTNLQPFWYSWGFGLTNFLFAFPAYALVDTKGRRWLLLWSFPAMGLFLLATGLSDKINEVDHRVAHTVVPYVFTLIFTAIYSFSCGPVPFAYSAEVHPLTTREVGMSFSVFWNFLGAGLLSLFVPARIPNPTVLLGIFTGLCGVSWLFIFLFVPETMNKTLEEMNYIFGVPTLRHAHHQLLEMAPFKLKVWYRYLTFNPMSDEEKEREKPNPLYKWWREKEDQSEAKQWSS